MPAFGTDNFSGLAAGTSLHTRSPWVKHPSVPDADVVATSAGRARANAANSQYLYDVAPVSADYEVAATLYAASGGAGGYAGVTAHDGTGDGSIWAIYRNGLWELWSKYAVVATFAQTLSDGQSYRLRLKVVGGQATVYVDGAVVIDAGLPAGYVATAGRAGLITAGPYTDSTGYHLDDFAAGTDVDVPAVVVSRRVVCDGNSMTYGYAVPAANAYPELLKARLGPTWQIVNRGVNSQTTADMLADAAADVDALYDPALAANVVVCWEATNHVFYGASSADAIAAIWSYCDGRRAAGFRVALVTLLPRDDWTGSGIPGATDADKRAEFEIRRATVNAAYRQDWPLHADAIIDLAIDARLADPHATTYFADLTHLTAAGNGIVADYAACGIGAALSASVVAVTALAAPGDVRQGVDRGDGTLGTFACPPAPPGGGGAYARIDDDTGGVDRLLGVAVRPIGGMRVAAYDYAAWLAGGRAVLDESTTRADGSWPPVQLPAPGDYLIEQTHPTTFPARSRVVVDAAGVAAVTDLEDGE